MVTMTADDDPMYIHRLRKRSEYIEKWYGIHWCMQRPVNRWAETKTVNEQRGYGHTAEQSIQPLIPISKASDASQVFIIA